MVTQFNAQPEKYRIRQTYVSKLKHVLTMRKLIRMIYHMLVERKEWKYEDPGLTESVLNILDDD